LLLVLFAVLVFICYLVMEPVEIPITTSFVVYNWLQDSAISKVIVDVRSTQLFDIGYIKTAINVPILDTDSNEELNLNSLDETLDAKNKIFKNRGLLFTRVVVYDGDGEGLPAKRLVRALLKENKLAHVKLLQGGYRIFAVQHPFLCSSSVKKSLGGAYPSAIVDNFLYLGSYENAKNKQQLQDLGISHIINVAGELENEFPKDFKYKDIKLDDTSVTNLGQHLDDALQFIDEARAASSKVLVHCAMGISRSSSIVIAYLMHAKGWSYQEAHEFVRSMRSCIKPNPGFRAQLVTFEKQLTARRSSNVGIASVTQEMVNLDLHTQVQTNVTDSTTTTTTTIEATAAAGTTATITIPMTTTTETAVPVQPLEHIVSPE